VHPGRFDAPSPPTPSHPMRPPGDVISFVTFYVDSYSPTSVRFCELAQSNREHRVRPAVLEFRRAAALAIAVWGFAASPAIEAGGERLHRRLRLAASGCNYRRFRGKRAASPDARRCGRLCGPPLRRAGLWVALSPTATGCLRGLGLWVASSPTSRRVAALFCESA
jgi:hypothetical protein